MSDVVGIMWLDVAKRDWSDVILQAHDLSHDRMLALCRGSEITGTSLPEVAEAWDMATVLVIAGGNDNAAGAAGAGMVGANQTMLSLGASGVYFAASEGLLSEPESAIHSFCHALPQRQHLMSAALSTVLCLDWAARLTGLSNVPALIAATQQADEGAEPTWFLSYLSGEHTPHDNPQAKGVFFGLTHQHDPDEPAQAVLEGAGYMLADGTDAMHVCNIKPQSVTLIRGGARGEYWHQMPVDISGQQLDYRARGDVGSALGVARLAQIAASPEKLLIELLPQLPLRQSHLPDAQHYAAY